MLIPKKNREIVYSNLFKEGVLVCKKDWNVMHQELKVPNLHVCKLMLSMKSKGHVKETFSWQWYYYYLTNEGVSALREYLHLPDDVMPATLKKSAAKPATGGRPGYEQREQRGGDRGGDRAPRTGGREGYRGATGGDDKKNRWSTC